MELPARGAVPHQITPYAPVSVTIICMSPRLKTLVLAAALLVMPLQGIAATLSDLLCDGEAQMHAMHASGGPDRGTHQDSSEDAGGTSGNSVYHPCHNTISAPLVVTFLAAAPAFPVRAFVPDTLYGLFVPEQPQRPPLA